MRNFARPQPDDHVNLGVYAPLVTLTSLCRTSCAADQQQQQCCIIGFGSTLVHNLDPDRYCQWASSYLIQ